jgi:DNA-binding transcriptional regulator YdaS (Cro superfamily)
MPSGARALDRQRIRRGSQFRSPATQRAIKKAGGVRALAAALGITPASVCEWPYIPIDRLVAVERLTGIDRAKLRPDLKYLWQ